MTEGIELRVNNNQLSVAEIDSRRRSNASQVSQVSTGEYYTDSPNDLKKSKKRAEKEYHVKDPGPVMRRRCRDVFWAFLFIQYWLIMFVVAYYAINRGNPLRLLYGMDSEGNLCGVNNTNGRDLQDMSYLFYFDLTDPTSGYARCVSSCPNYTWYYELPTQSSPELAICAYDFPQPTNSSFLQEAVQNGSCASMVLVSTPVISRCFPDLGSDFNNQSILSTVEASFISMLNERGVSFEIQRDLYACWQVILICAAFSIVLSFVWILLLQFCAGFMILITILMLILTTLAAMLYLWFNYYQLRTGNTIISPDIPFITNSSLNSYAYSQNTYLVVGIITTVFSVILYAALIFLRRRIMLATVIIKVASRAVRAVPLLVFFPLIKVGMLLVLSAWFIFIIVNLATAGEVTQLDFAGYYTFKSDYILEYLQLYYLFGFLWTWNLTIALGDCTIAGTVGAWYWTKDKKKLPAFMIIPALWRTLRYHIGSLAFGSFIIALVQFIRYLLYKLEKKLKGSQNWFLQNLLKVLQCLFLCFERFLKFLNKNAYIEIAIYGYSFCKGAKWAFQLITRNVIRVVVVTKLGDYLLLIGKIIITILVAIVGNLLIEYYSSNPTYWVTPMIVIVLIAYGTAYCFMAVIEMSVSTIFLCFCEDIERNDGSEQKPYFMDPKLRKYIDKEARAESDLVKK